MKADEIASTLADRDYWRELETYLPWKLHGFTYRTHASFFTQEHTNHVLELTGVERDEILAAIQQKGKP